MNTTEMIMEQQITEEEMLMIDVAKAVNELLDDTFMPSLVKVGMGEMVNQ